MAWKGCGVRTWGVCDRRNSPCRVTTNKILESNGLNASDSDVFVIYTWTNS